jgi:hypothetical protein
LVLRFDPLTELVMQLKIEERHFYDRPAVDGGGPDARKVAPMS